MINGLFIPVSSDNSYSNSYDISDVNIGSGSFDKLSVNSDLLPEPNSVSLKFLRRKIMCGFCNFRCEKVPSFHVEFTDGEIKRINDKYLYPIGDDSKLLDKNIVKFGDEPNGVCRFLTDVGCSLGDDKPKFCKLYPLEVNKNNTLVLANWSILHCPQPEDFDFVGMSEDKGNGKFKYWYKPKKNNINNHDIFLDFPISDFPPLYIYFKQFLIDSFGQKFYDKLLVDMKNFDDSLKVVSQQSKLVL